MEWFPIIFSGVSLFFAASLAIYVLLTECIKPKNDPLEGDNPSSVTKEQVTESSSVFPRKSVQDHQVSEVSGPTKDASLGNETEVVSVMAWTGVSCVYSGKQSQDDVCVLDNCYGSLREGQVTAIMGPRYVISIQKVTTNRSTILVLADIRIHFLFISVGPASRP